MRLFQNSAIYPSYRPRLATLTSDCGTFKDYVGVFLNDRFGAAHFLKPILDRDRDAFFANGDDEKWQRQWAKEQGMSAATSLEDILLAQIEHHRTEVFYNLDPMRFGNDVIARLPGSVRRTIAWRAAPSAGGQFNDYDLVVSNFPSISRQFEKQGARVAYFSPAHDPAMDRYALNTDRNIDVLFVGTYSRHHVKRARLLAALAALGSEFNIALHLDRSRFTALADSPLGLAGPLNKFRRPAAIRRSAKAPLFGRDLLSALGRSKIVINGAIDMSGNERGNMRVWEALGCGATMVSDQGVYPQPMRPGIDFETYSSVEDAINKTIYLLNNSREQEIIAMQGYKMISSCFTKIQQWQDFSNLAN